MPFFVFFRNFFMPFFVFFEIFLCLFSFHKSLNYIYTNIYINYRFVHLLTWWQAAHWEPPPCSIFPASHILKAREKNLPMGNSLGKYKTTDTAGISFLFYHYHENPICTIGTTRLITLYVGFKKIPGQWPELYNKLVTGSLKYSRDYGWS